MTKGELLDKLEEFEIRANKILVKLDDTLDEYCDLYYDIIELRKECEDDDNER